MVQTGWLADLKDQQSLSGQNPDLVTDEESRVFPLVTQEKQQAGEPFHQCPDLLLDMVVVRFRLGLDASSLYFHHEVYNGMRLSLSGQTS